MRDLRRRLEQLEYAHLKRLAAETGKPYNMSADVILNYARDVYALSEAEQRQRFHAFYATLTEAEIEELAEIKTWHAAILGRMHRDSRWRDR